MDTESQNDSKEAIKIGAEIQHLNEGSHQLDNQVKFLHDCFLKRRDCNSNSLQMYLVLLENIEILKGKFETCDCEPDTLEKKMAISYSIQLDRCQNDNAIYASIIWAAKHKKIFEENKKLNELKENMKQRFTEAMNEFNAVENELLAMCRHEIPWTSVCVQFAEQFLRSRQIKFRINEDYAKIRALKSHWTDKISKNDTKRAGDKTTLDDVHAKKAKVGENVVATPNQNHFQTAVRMSTMPPPLSTSTVKLSSKAVADVTSKSLVVAMDESDDSSPLLAEMSYGFQVPVTSTAKAGSNGDDFLRGMIHFDNSNGDLSNKAFPTFFNPFDGAAVVSGTNHSSPKSVDQPMALDASAGAGSGGFFSSFFGNLAADGENPLPDGGFSFSFGGGSKGKPGGQAGSGSGAGFGMFGF